MTVAARAFGRRLPFTALVPFADCLNHANVAVKYDYDVDKNGLFRLFPTRSHWCVCVFSVRLSQCARGWRGLQ